MHRTTALLGLSLLLAATLPAQIVDTLGGTASAPTRQGMAKANLFRVDKTVLLIKLEMYLNVPGAETLTFFRYRHHSQDGAYKLDWTKPVKVSGTGTGWYSAGTISVPLIEGNHYMLGVSWAGTLTYHYKTASSGQAVSFGAWHRGVTPTGLPATYKISGVDIAQYYQRLSTIPIGKVVSVGKPCTSATSPRLVAATLPEIGKPFTLDLVEAQGSTPVIHLMNPNPALPTPIPIFGCTFWLNPVKGPLLLFTQVTDVSGTATLSLPIPGDPWLAGLVMTWQSAVAGKTIPLTNAIQGTL